MSYRLDIKPMPDNPARGTDTSGLWRIFIEDMGSESVPPKFPPRRAFKENLSYEEAFELAEKMHNDLNSG